VRKLEPYDPLPTIVGGDFNTSPFYFAFKSIPIFPYSQRKRINTFMIENGFSTLASSDVPTYRGIPMKLDHIYASGAGVRRHGVEKDVRISDHRPVWADLVFA